MRHPVIEDDLTSIVSAPLPWQELSGKTIVVSGAGGMLPAYMVETLLFLNETVPGQRVKVVALVRNGDKAMRRFTHYRGRSDLLVLVQDVCCPVTVDFPVDIIIHAASQASPKYYGVDPVGTLTANVIGTYNMLELARRIACKSVLFFSSGEVYGTANSSGIPVREDCYGAVDPLDIRACYPESKRMGETMCMSWMRQYGIAAKIVRPFHTYGPGMSLDDGRVFADFVAAVVNGTPLRLNSSGEAKRVFCYLSDATQAFFTVLLKGENGQAYNVANPSAEISVAGLADLLVSLFPEKKLAVLKKPVYSELASKTPQTLPDITKITELGWRPNTGLAPGFRRTVESFTDLGS
ncbi:MAG: NAD-dependent epimerase/dehydratase family protein [bacterium]